MRLLCPAKINLHLRVGPLREDGFHPLLSWFCTAGLFDTLTLEQATPFAGVEDSFVALRCDNPDLPCDRRNLVVRIGEAFAQEARQIGGASTSLGTGAAEKGDRTVKGYVEALIRADNLREGNLGGGAPVPSEIEARVFPVTVDLRKRIPAGAGLGGGSSDGARMLLGLNSLWNTGRAADSLSGFAARFGSDLPFFLFGPSSVCKGRGEIVKPVLRPRPRWVLLVLPAIVMPTPEVYRRFDAMQLGRAADIEIEPDWIAWSKLDARELMDCLVNDLETPAFSISAPLSALRETLAGMLGRAVRMSGSGSSLFTLYDALDEAYAARDGLKRSGAFDRIRLEAVDLAPTISDDLAP
jgi:4-diphosphocytidyl-2-C-methyl-D-erythritol kinase